MNEKTYNFKVKGTDEKERQEKLKAADAIIKNLKHADLLLLANAIKTNPELIDQARPFLT